VPERERDVLTPATFDSKQMNRAALGEFVLAVLTTQMDAFRRLLGTTELTVGQLGWALVPALGLLILWELGKLIARRVTAADDRSGEPLPEPGPGSRRRVTST
jgi:Ca2+-transporting ATPase